MEATATPSCPKCGAPRGDTAACPKCGLLADRMATFASQLDASVPDVARAAWEKARASWDDLAAHDELLRLTTLHGCFAWTAARYREAQAEDSAGDRAIADKQLERTRKAAEAALLASGDKRHTRGAKPFQSSILVLVLILVLLVVGIVYARWRAKADAPAPPRPSSGTVR